MGKPSLISILFQVLLVLLIVLLFRNFLNTLLAAVLAKATNPASSGNTFAPASDATPITLSRFPTSRPPVGIGTELQVGDTAVSVTRVVWPADAAVRNTDFYKMLESGQHFLLVGITVRCTSSDTSCRLTEFDFGVKSASGQDTPAELTTGFDGLSGLFEGGEIKPGQSLSGDLVFIIAANETGLTLVYPRMYAFGGSAEFTLTP